MNLSYRLNNHGSGRNQVNQVLFTPVLESVYTLLFYGGLQRLVLPDLADFLADQICLYVSLLLFYNLFVCLLKERTGETERMNDRTYHIPGSREEEA